MKTAENWQLFKLEIFDWQFRYEGILNQTSPLLFMEFRCIETNCVGHVVILWVSHAQKIMSNMPFFGKSDIQHFWRWP